jgi:imidazolonepropionase-like amidohydrolase
MAQEKILIKNVQVFDGDKVIKNTDVLIEGKHIVEIGVVNCDTCKIIDGKGKTLLPAFTNAHVHTWSFQSLREAAKSGILNLFDMHGIEQVQASLKLYKDSVNYANYYVAGYAATAPNGHGTQYGFPVPTLAGSEDAKKFVKDRILAGADYIKIILEPWKTTLSYKTIKAIIDEAHAYNKVAVVHISKVVDAFNVLNDNADGLVHLWWDKTMPNEQLTTLAKEKDFFVIPTLLTSIRMIEMIKKNNPLAVALSEDELKSEVKRLYDAGIPILAGTDPPNAQINYGTDLFKELILLSESGIPTIDVLKGATSLPIKRFKLGKKGMIKVGYIADLVLIDGNPIEEIKDINKIHTVWKAGVDGNLE